MSNSLTPGTGNTSPAYMEWLARQLDSRQNHVSGLLSLVVQEHIKPGVEAVLMEVIKSQMETNELLRNALTANWKYPEPQKPHPATLPKLKKPNLYI